MTLQVSRVGRDVRCVKCAKLMGQQVGEVFEVRIKGRLVVTVSRGSLYCSGCGVEVSVEAGNMQIRSAV